MFIATKNQTLNIIFNLMLADLRYAKNCVKRAEHKTVRDDFTDVVDIYNDMLQRSNVSVACDMDDEYKERICAENFAEARSAYNGAELQRKFFALDGIKFFVDISTDQQPIKLETTYPETVCKKIGTAFRVPEYTHIQVRLLERRQHFINGCTAETIFSAATTEEFNDRLLQADPARYLDNALAAAYEPMILKFARRQTRLDLLGRN